MFTLTRAVKDMGHSRDLHQTGQLGQVMRHLMLWITKNHSNTRRTKPQYKQIQIKTQWNNNLRNHFLHFWNCFGLRTLRRTCRLRYPGLYFVRQCSRQIVTSFSSTHCKSNQHKHLLGKKKVTSFYVCLSLPFSKIIILNNILKFQNTKPWTTWVCIFVTERNFLNSKIWNFMVRHTNELVISSTVPFPHQSYFCKWSDERCSRFC